MPEMRECDPTKYDFVDWLEYLKKTASYIFGIPSCMFTDEPPQTEMDVTLIQKFTREQRIMLNKIKEQAQDVEFEEI